MSRRMWIAALLLMSSALGSAAQAKLEPASDALSAAVDSNEAPLSLESSLALRDPFRRPKLKNKGVGDEGGSVPELERYSLEEFSLVGVITGAKKNKALLSLPGGKMVIVQESMILGPRRGLITKIVPGAVFVQEKVVNLLGQEEKIDTIIEFKEAKEGELRAKQ